MINIEKGISIILYDWLNVSNDELIHFVTDENHIREAEAITKWANGADAILKTTILPSNLVQNGQIIEKMAHIFSNENVIIGATDYSFITTKAIKTAVKKGARFLSLPLSCKDGTSLLENDFIQMNVRDAQRNANRLVTQLSSKSKVHVTTKLGTDITFSIESRIPGSFVGKAKRPGIISSASFEVYVAPIENSMNGTLYLDASIGYIGLVDKPIKITVENGTFTKIESEDDGAQKLIDYLDSFKDPIMYKPGEFGIGLNKLSKCRGICYIEDESTYSTFHIGMGRNISLGGKQEAAGHFDIVINRPDVYVDNEIIIANGEII